MKTKLIQAAILTLALAAGLTARAAGDLIEILPCGADGTTLSAPVSSVGSPVDCNTHYFKLRLVNRVGYPTQPWVLKSKVASPDDPLKMYVWISGELREAVYTGTSVQNADKKTTDFVFGFTPKAGDLALPVVLATKATSGAVGRADVSGLTEGTIGYYLANDHLWGFYPNGDTAEPEAVLILNDTNAIHASRPEGGDWTADYSLARAGFYIKEIDFDANAYDGTYWRSINQNDTTCVNTSLPMLKVNSPENTSSAFVYVWTKDKSVAELSGNSASIGEQYAINGTDEDGNPLVTTGLKMQVAANSDSKSFYIKAKGAVGDTTTVYMAETPTNIYYNSGAVITNFVTRTIVVDEPNPPNAKLFFNGDEEVKSLALNADSDYQTTKAQLMVKLSEPYTADITVKLAAKYTDTSVIDLLNATNISLSVTDTASSWSDPANSVTIPAGQTQATFYLHVLGGSAQTKDGILFSIDSITGDGGYFTTTTAQSTLTINPATPRIVNPVSGAAFEGARTGETFLFEDFRLDDTYANRKRGQDEGYKVFYKRTYSAGGGDAKFQTANFTNALDGTANGAANVLGIKLAKAGTATVTMYLQAPDDTKTEVADYVTFTIDVTQSPQVAPVVASGLDAEGYAPEGGTLKISVSLTEENSTAGTLYAYLVPADEATSNNVASCDALAQNGASGVPIPADTKDGARTVTLVLNDGSALGGLMTFKVFVSDKDKLGAPDYTTYPDYGYAAYDGYAEGTLMMYVANVQPTVEYIQMGASDQVGVSGDTFSTTTSQGIECKFAVKVKEPSKADLDEATKKFIVKLTFYDGSAAPQVRYIYGNPNTLTTEGEFANTTNFTFQTAGLNRVVVALKDKDMEDFGEAFTAYVQVNETPGVTIASGRPDLGVVYPETGTGPVDGALAVNLTAAADIKLKVGLLVDYAKTGDTFLLPELNLNKETADLSYYGLGTAVSVYVVEFNAGYLASAQNVYFTTLDGTAASAKNGVKITPYVLTEGTSTYGISYKQLYDNLQPLTVYPENVAPEIIVPSEGMEMVTNQASIGVIYTRPWAVSDITGDFMSNDAKVELTVEGETTVVAQGAAADESAVTAGGTFTYSFTSTGAKTVTLTVTDKDGEQTTRNLYFMIDPAKNVYVYPHGGNFTAPSKLSERYVGADGLGSGYVWRDGVLETDAASKYTARHIYSFDKSATSAIFVGLGDTAQFLGNGSASTKTLDSYLYGWIVDTAAENGVFTGEILGVNPTYGNSPTYADAFAKASQYERLVKLPSSDEFDEAANAYEDRHVEAIFALEWRAADNMGDINADGIPDFFAVKKAYISEGPLLEADGTGGDLKNLATLNDDGDFYPAATQLGGQLIPGATSGWATSGQKFTTLLEVRGYHNGLNYGMFKADTKEMTDGWISDLDLSVPEKKALVRAATGAKWGALPSAAAMLADVDTDSDADYSDAEILAWLGTPAEQANAKAFIDATWADYQKGEVSTWGFTVENRTDPTTDDTDGESNEGGVSMPDGYEYYFWYAATVGFTDDGTTLVGSRFTLDPATFEKGVDIASEEIATIFNPTVNRDWTKQDTDNDGIYDIEEMLIGTSPVFWDTDKDGLSDLFELMYGMDPLQAVTENTHDSTKNWDGDHMAYAVLGEYDIYQDGGKYYAVSAATTTDVDTDMDAVDDTTIVSGTGFEVVPFDGRYMPATRLFKPAAAERTVFLALPLGTTPSSGTVALYHFQVYNYYEFDPRTGWGGNYPSTSTLSNMGRWKKKVGGQAVNTKAYTAIDEFRLLEYRYLLGLRNAVTDQADIDAEKTTMAAVLAAGTTNPNVARDAATVGDSTTAYGGLENHGADTDGDGVPDGWELYVGVNPNVVYTSTSEGLYGEIRELDAEDGLDLAAEFAGTDSCQRYSSCETVYANHPSQEGGAVYRWYNKFFPTDPRDDDTDGDGIKDGDERESWSGPLEFGRWGQGNSAASDDLTGVMATHATIYGNYPDTGTHCIRGGGLNPNTIDTDHDGLPDPWELQYAGIVFKGDKPADEEGLKSIDSESTLPEKIYDHFRAAAKAYNYGEEGSDAYYVIMGQDGTFPDAQSSIVNDRDWDGDGLQNWQEYMVQAMRHLRYDDSVTPLMGRDKVGFDALAGVIAPGAWNGAGGASGQSGYYLPSLSAELSESELTALEQIGYENYAAYVRQHPDYLRTLGYFAVPPKAWDFVGEAGTLNYRYMLPPETIILDAATTPQQEFDTLGRSLWAYSGNYVADNGYDEWASPETTLDGIVVTNKGPELVISGIAIPEEMADDPDTAYELADDDTVVYLDGGEGTRYYYVIKVFQPDLLDPSTKQVFPVMVHRLRNPVDYKTELSYARKTVRGRHRARKYVSSDPRFWDTDCDGMDDYYEMFHGLNPLLGNGNVVDVPYVLLDEEDEEHTYYSSFDVIAAAYGNQVTTGTTLWQSGSSMIDAMSRPWMMGAGQSDADGDGLRNEEEAVAANRASAVPTHTDPTPLWMTDTSHETTNFEYSVTTVVTNYVYKNGKLAYSAQIVGGILQFLPQISNIVSSTSTTYIPLATSPSYTIQYYRQPWDSDTLNWSGGNNFAYDFEENEGYDTDGDLRSDSIELRKVVEPSSDPLDFSDPTRRQSLWFGGAGAAISFEPAARIFAASNADFLKQFTVEAWVRPDVVGGTRQYVVTRSCSYGGWDLLNPASEIRMNFGLGIDETGHAFARVENSTEIFAEIAGDKLQVGKWSHIAATYDGSVFAIYVDGALAARDFIAVQPATGIKEVLQEPQTALTDSFPVSGYVFTPSATVIGAKACGAGAFRCSSAAAATSWDDVANDFYSGSVAEVRVWDGARTAEQIKRAYDKAFTTDEIKEMIENVYAAYAKGARRNDNSGAAVLPAELVQHYNFSTLAGATSPAYVQQVPAGFETNVLAQVQGDGARIDAQAKVGWWSAVIENAAIAGGQVYASPYVVPWIQNTLAHLPRLDGTIADSIFWSENYAGYTPASFQGLDSFEIHNTMNPYNVAYRSGWSSAVELKTRILNGDDETGDTALRKRYVFDNRRELVGTSDLVPVGNVYAKRLTESWDGMGPEDAWAITTDGTADDGVDGDPTDAGIPAWAVAAGYTDAAKYRAALEDGLLPDGNFAQNYTVYATDSDTNGNGIADWWERHFGIFDCDPNEDLDNDGLSNYQEFLISFGDYSTVTETNASWRLNAGECRNKGMPVLDPTNARSTGAAVTDYFLKPDFSLLSGVSHITDKTYLGEMVTDHDFMEMWWERENGLRDSNLTSYYSNPFVYDPHLDLDGDGWSNYAEARAYSWHGGIHTDEIDTYYAGSTGNHIGDYPQPSLGLNVTYYGSRDITKKSLVVRTRRGSAKRVDATLVMAGTEQLEGADASAVNYHMIGTYPGRTTVRGFLHPGQVSPGSSTKFQKRAIDAEILVKWHCDTCEADERNAYARGAISWTVRGFSGENYLGDGVFAGTQTQFDIHYANHNRKKNDGSDVVEALGQIDPMYEQFAETSSDETGRYGFIVLTATNSVDLADRVVGTIDFRTGEYALDFAKVEDAGVDSAGMLFRVAYHYRVADEWPKTIWLNDTTIAAGHGRIKEGKNIIEAFIDLNLNNLWDEGEPYGMVKDVDIGWHKTGEAIDIELSDETPVMKRASVAFGSTDGSDSSSGSGSGVATAKVSVRRAAIDGVSEGLPARTLGSTTAISDDRAYITEADILTAAQPDLDWKWLTKDAAQAGLPLNNATYEVVRIDTLDDGTKTNSVLAMFTRVFSAKRATATALAPVQSAPVYAARPTFTFQSGDETMTAYRLQVATNETSSGVIWDSGVVALPGRVAYTLENGATYRVSPELYVDTFATTNGTAILLDGSNYHWRVALLNAKFNSVDESNDEDWSAWSSFQMDVCNKHQNPDTQTGYGNAAAAVRYYGAGTMTDTATSSTNIIVEAYASADFTGIPLARMRVEDLSLLSSAADVATTNVALRGLPPGEYFLVAFIDANNNGRRDTFESWGYANYVGEDTKFIYKPKAIEVTNSTVLFPSTAIFIEDTDINQDEVPDCLESLTMFEEVIDGTLDSDNDRLTDETEEDIGTDPYSADSDGDGMPDGDEVDIGSNPLENDAGSFLDGDVMAYAELKNQLVVTVTNGTDEATYWVKASDVARSLQIGDAITASFANNFTFATTFQYGTEENWIYAAGAVVTNADATTPWRVTDVKTATIALVHAQVYDYYGFNPKTANPSVSSNEWAAVHSKAFTYLDKHLVKKWLEAEGVTDAEDAVLSVTTADSNGDGIADGWELYTMFGPAGATATLDAAQISPWKTPDYVRDYANTPDGGRLTILDEYDGGTWPTDPWSIDTDGDGVFDVYAYLYHLKGDQAGLDNDGDGLSNYAEYLVSEVFQIVALDPNKAMTDDSTLDYFRKFGELYLGEVFTDHDRVADLWEANYESGTLDGIDYAARGVYDPDADRDGDGWSNYAEYRAGTSPARQMSTGIDEYTLIEHPVPVVEMEIVYNGTADIEGRTLTVSAWNETDDADALKAPTATWTVTTANETATESGKVNATTGEEAMEKYLGQMPTGTRTYYLRGGAVKEGSFKLSFKDKNYVEGQIVEMYGQNYFQPTGYGDADEALWFYDVIDQGGKLVTRGGIFAEAHQVGTIDYDTGRVTINFDDEEFTDDLFVGNPAESSGSKSNSGSTNVYHGLNPPTCYVLLSWSPAATVPVKGRHYLSDATTGFLREGPTTFAVEVGAGDGDVDQNSTTTASAGLYGVVRHVDVGWAGAKFTVELTDFSPVTPRIDLWAGTPDRSDVVPFDDPRINNESNVLEAVTAEGSLAWVRVVRYAINGYPIVPTWGAGLVDVVYENTFNLTGRTKLTELDFLGKDMFDVDWTDSFTNKVANADGVPYGTYGSGGVTGPAGVGSAGDIMAVLGADITRIPPTASGQSEDRTKPISWTAITNIQYMVVIGDGPATWERGASNVVSALSTLITRRFDRVRARPVAVAVDGLQYAARPTFKWQMEGEEALVSRYGSSYTAFKLQVKNAAGTVIYDSGIRRAPATDANGNFTWTAPICAGSLLKGEDGNAYFYDTTGNYTWQVSMYNAKFRSDFWSEQNGESVFTTAVNEQQEVNDHGYSSIKAAVKYAGPSNVLDKVADLATTKGKVIVQAFTTPDFSGEPLAQCLATEDVANTALALANAQLKGLAAIGTYYVRAFIDMDGDGELDAWEPWGYAKDAVTLVNDGTMSKAPLVAVWIEDSDSDGDWVPDAYEYAASDWETDWETLKGNRRTAATRATTLIGEGGIVLKIATDSLTGAGISKGLPGASFTAMQSEKFVLALLGYTNLGNKTTLEAIAEVTRGKLVPNSVKVVAITLKPDGSAVNLTVNADVASGISGTVVSEYYAFTGSDTVQVNVKVWKKDSLEDATWEVVYTTPAPVTITPLTNETVVVPFDKKLDLKSGFFRVELVEVVTP